MSVKVRPYRRGGWEVDVRVRLPDGAERRERKRAPSSGRSPSSSASASENESWRASSGPRRKGSASGGRGLRFRSTASTASAICL
jgi:hypothetical protein